MHRHARVAVRLGGFVIALVAGAVVSQSAGWFDSLTPLQLFLVVGGGLAVIIFAVEQIYRYEYSRDVVSAQHLEGLKATATGLLECIVERASSVGVNERDLRDLSSHRKDIERAVAKWDAAIKEVAVAQVAYLLEVSKLFDAEAFQEPRFNRLPMQNAVIWITHEREERRQLSNGVAAPMTWTWTVTPTHTPTGPRNDLWEGRNGDSLFARDVDNPIDPLDIQDCQRRFEALFDAADSAPELTDWVRKEQALRYDPLVDELRELLHEFGRRDHLRRGRGCAQCS
jgi:hypothetical protein